MPIKLYICAYQSVLTDGGYIVQDTNDTIPLAASCNVVKSQCKTMGIIEQQSVILLSICTLGNNSVPTGTRDV